MSYEKQLRLEEESVTMGQERYSKRLKGYVQHRNEDQSAPAVQLMKRVVETVGTAIEQDRNEKRRGRTRMALPLIAEVESEVLAWHGLRAIMSSMHSRTPFARAAIRTGNSIKDEINFRRFQASEKRSYEITQRHIAKAPTGNHKRGVMGRMFTLSEIDAVDWSLDEATHVGTYVLDIALRVSQWADAVLVTERKKRVRLIHPRQNVLDWLSKAHGHLAALTPVRMPMVVPPLPWTTPNDGGYMTDLGGELSLVKSFNKGYLESLEQIDMPEVYAALNAIQETPWQINTSVLEVAQAVWEEGQPIGPNGDESMPSRDPAEVPAIPHEWEGKVREWKESDFESFKLWARRAAHTHDENRRMISKRISCASKLSLATKFQADEAIYFPHQLDFRGRVYPVASHITPQGDDLSKGLLRFSKGKPITTEGIFWFKVHVANCFGVDKVSFEDRVAWTDDHLGHLLDSGLEPLEGNRFWCEADDPFMALAACFELVGIVAEGPDYVSHLPISMDGSCNGLQNFSALLKDSVGGKATNLVPSDQPADIYQQVADLVAERVSTDAAAGEASALMFDGIITRKVVKQPVMTQPYGATRNGMLRQIEDAVKKAGNPTNIATRDMWTACGYIADVTYEAIGQVVIAARDAMDWLQEVARIAAKEDFPIHWTSPVGLPVLQEYRQMDATVLRVHIDGQKVKLSVNTIGTKLDRRRQAGGISPNLIHSFDAAHMMKTALLAQANGVSAFAMIHDSFGCHAADVPVLHASIRASFVEQYDTNLLDAFKAELTEQLPDDIELPPIPASGDLDLSVVNDSWYFFA